MYGWLSTGAIQHDWNLQRKGPWPSEYL